jgi:invasion protein IalB
MFLMDKVIFIFRLVSVLSTVFAIVPHRSDTTTHTNIIEYINGINQPVGELQKSKSAWYQVYINCDSNKKNATQCLCICMIIQIFLLAQPQKQGVKNRALACVIFLDFLRAGFFKKSASMEKDLLYRVNLNRRR